MYVPALAHLRPRHVQAGCNERSTVSFTAAEYRVEIAGDQFHLAVQACLRDILKALFTTPCRPLLLCDGPVSNNAGCDRPQRHAAIARHRLRRHQQLRTVNLGGGQIAERCLHNLATACWSRATLKDRHALLRDRGFWPVSEDLISPPSRRGIPSTSGCGTIGSPVEMSQAATPTQDPMVAFIRNRKPGYSACSRISCTEIVLTSKSTPSSTSTLAISRTTCVRYAGVMSAPMASASRS